MKIRKLGRYVIDSEMGRGAIGVVYRATDPMLDRLVAIKTVNTAIEPDGEAEYEARFYQEAKAAGGLNHPNIVTIYDIGKSGNTAYMAMELLEGRELLALLAPGEPLAVAQAVDIATQVAEGLGYAHQHGVVHRDINPAIPAMLDLIVAKALAKSPDDRYADARTLAADLRECRKWLEASPMRQGVPAAGSVQAQSQVDLESASALLIRSYPDSRHDDGEEAPLDPSPTLGLAKAFDSSAATLRLAAKTGMGRELHEYANAQKSGVAETTTVRGTIVDTAKLKRGAQRSSAPAGA